MQKTTFFVLSLLKNGTRFVFFYIKYFHVFFLFKTERVSHVLLLLGKSLTHKSKLEMVWWWESVRVFIWIYEWAKKWAKIGIKHKMSRIHGFCILHFVWLLHVHLTELLQNIGCIYASSKKKSKNFFQLQQHLNFYTFLLFNKKKILFWLDWNGLGLEIKSIKHKCRKHWLILFQFYFFYFYHVWSVEWNGNHYLHSPFVIIQNLFGLVANSICIFQFVLVPVCYVLLIFALCMCVMCIFKHS